MEGTNFKHKLLRERGRGSMVVHFFKLPRTPGLGFEVTSAEALA